MSTRSVGEQYESLAADYLSARGFRIIERNFTCKGGELDLVCDDAGTLVFVEVRARADGDYGSPEETIRHEKKHRIVHAARVYLQARGIVEEATPCRFDVIAVEGEEIRYFMNAFE